MRPELSIVMPVYNEASVIESVVTDLRRDVCDHLSSVEMVVVNDASTDETAAILDRLARTDERIRVLHAVRNGGHGPAVRHALEQSRGEWMFQIDSDAQQVPAEFWKLWD